LQKNSKEMRTVERTYLRAAGHDGALPGANVTGLDPDSRALLRARRKAERSQLSISFDQGISDNLPYPDASFDRFEAQDQRMYGWRMGSLDASHRLKDNSQSRILANVGSGALHADRQYPRASR
jgi:hypothetical protein